MKTTRGAGLFLLLSAFLSACSTLPRDGGEDFPLEVLQAGGISALTAQWQPLSAGGGLSLFAGKIKEPPLEFWALKIEGAGGGESVPGEGPWGRIFLGAGGGSTRPGHVLSTRVSSFVRDNGLLAGINTVPFDPSSAREGEERRVAGIAISGGALIAPPIARYDALVFYRDGGAAIVNQGEFGESPSPEILHAVGGFHRILREGELTERALEKAEGPRYARSAAGLSRDGRTLYLIVINGGFPGSKGATEAETALILKRLGAGDALNLDGGGSSALALRLPRGGIRILNTPSHGGFPGWERAVALCLGIRFSPGGD
jgi:hypothetical protein